MKKLIPKLIHLDMDIVNELIPYMDEDCIKLPQLIRKLLREELNRRKKCLNQN